MKSLYHTDEFYFDHIDKFNILQMKVSWSMLTIKIQMQLRCVLGTVTSKVTLFTIPYIHPLHHGNPKGHPFCSKSIGPPILEIRLFQNFTLKIQGQGHGYSQRARSHSRISIQMICSIFISYQSDQQFQIKSYLKIWLWKIQGHGQAQSSRSHSLRSIQLMHFLFA